MEEGDKEELGGSEKLSQEGRHQDEEGEVLVQEAEELDDQLEVRNGLTVLRSGPKCRV